MADEGAQKQNHTTAGTFLLSAAFLCACAAVVVLIFYPGVFGVALLLSIVALISGRAGFKRLEAAEKIHPVPINYIEAFDFRFKNGTEVHLTLEVEFLGFNDARCQNKINYQIQRCLNVFFLRIDSLSEEPFSQIDDVLKPNLGPLEEKLRISDLVVQTTDVRIAGLAPPASQGIYLGGY